MTLLTVVQDVCAVVGVVAPTSVFSGINANRTMYEMLALANEMAQRIAYDTKDWTKLKKVQSFPGDGTTEAWPLPANFKRLLLTTNVWRSTSAMQPMAFVPDLDQWLQRRFLNHSNAWGEWTMYGGLLYIWPILPATETATFSYLDKNCISLASGGVGDSFLSDNDVFLIDERLLKLGMIWQWKAQKGAAYSEDMATYGDALTTLIGKDSPSPILTGRYPVSNMARVAYPWPVPT